MLEEYAREMIYAEELHLGEVDKMLRNPGDIAAFDSKKVRAAEAPPRSRFCKNRPRSSG
jgi:hypothetical protein